MANTDITQRSIRAQRHYHSPAGRDFAGARRRAPRSTVIALVVGIVLCVAGSGD